MIEVTRISSDDDPMIFEVAVSDEGGTSSHIVTVTAADHVRLTPAGHSPEVLLKAAFRFLLDQEPKEAILHRFEIPVISTYFPQFEANLPNYLSRVG